MTSLIDVIFLLLLFFMLSSTFSRFSEVALQAGGAGTTDAAPPHRVLFLRVAHTGLTLNGAPLETGGLHDAMGAQDRPATVLVSVTGTASSQALTDLLVALRPFAELTVSVLGAS